MNDISSPPWQGGIYSTLRHGLTLANCDTEPVQTPGCIQGCGALLVLRPGDLTVAQVSQNSAAWLGRSPEALLGRSAAEVLGAEAAARLRALLERESIERNPLFVMSLPASAGGATRAVDVTMHTVDGALIVELEPAAHGETMDAYTMVRRASVRLQTADTLGAFCDAVAEEVRRVTGYDRVMIYRFHEDLHGEVVAERCRDDLSPWLGLHYPPEDIPQPARDVFSKIWVRPLPDAGGEMHELVPLANPDTGRALEMTHCALRGASTMYTEYLRNMGVAASLTLAIRSEGRLWGLVACHHCSAPAPTPWPVRAACELLAQMASLQLKVVEEREHFAGRLRTDHVHQQLIARAAHEGGLAEMIHGQPSLLEGIDAAGAALYHRERWWRVGVTPSDAQLDALSAWLATRPDFDSATRPLFATDSLARDWAPGAELAAVASGVLAFPLSRARRSVMLWFRPETPREVRWAGNPNDKPMAVGPHGPRLTPRASFELFLESVRGRARPWRPMEIDAAARLRVMVMELVVSRAEQLDALNADLSRSNEELDTFAYVASHDIKEPLRGIHKYAHLLLANATSLDEENRVRIEGLMRLTLRMDGLLDSLLHFSRVGRIGLEFEEIDLGEVLAEAVEMVGARVADGRVALVVPRPLPRVSCDRTRMREVLMNLLSNAIKYNDQPVPRVEVGYFAPDEPGRPTDTPEEAREQAVFFVRDNGIGIEPRHHAQVWNLFKRLHVRDAYGGGTGAGLTIVKRLVERHRGRVWIDSRAGEGTTFYFSLPAQQGQWGAEP